MNLMEKTPQERLNVRQWQEARSRRELRAEDLSLTVTLPDDLTSTQELPHGARAGRFYLYPVRTIDEGLAILTEISVGNKGEEGTVNDAVDQRLEEMVQGLKEFAVRDVSRESLGAPPSE